MSRPGAVAARVALENPHAPDALLAFLTITHPGLAEPIRVVSDVMDYLRDGQLYTGIPFGFALLTDGDEMPRTQLRLSAVDRRLSQAVRAFTGRPSVRLEIASSADFDLTRDPREPFGAVANLYGFSDFGLAEIDAAPGEITGEVVLHDYATEPFGLRGTQDLLPGLYR